MKNTKATYRQSPGAKLRHYHANHFLKLPQQRGGERWRSVCVGGNGRERETRPGKCERKPRRFLDVTVIFSARHVRNPDIYKHLSVEYRLPLSPGIWSPLSSPGYLLEWSPSSFPGIWIVTVIFRVPVWTIAVLRPGHVDCHRSLPGTYSDDCLPVSRVCV